jgi:formylglycine-generating enzyme required for sulfatase activity
VWEWTRSLWGIKSAGPDYPYPYRVTDGRENLAAGREVGRVVRGGAFDNDHGVVRCAYRFRGNLDVLVRPVGFRIVLHPAS